MTGQERNEQSLEAIFSARDDSRKLIKSNVFTEGYDAYYNKLEKSDNPYFESANPIEHQEWERGWKVAEEDYMSELFGAQEEDFIVNSSYGVKITFKNNNQYQFIGGLTKERAEEIAKEERACGKHDELGPYDKVEVVESSRRPIKSINNY